MDRCIDEGKKLPEFASQSANPVGRENIITLLSNYKRHELLDHIQKVIDYKHDWRKAVQEGKSLLKWNGKIKVN